MCGYSLWKYIQIVGEKRNIRSCLYYQISEELWDNSDCFLHRFAVGLQCLFMFQLYATHKPLNCYSVVFFFSDCRSRLSVPLSADAQTTSTFPPSMSSKQFKLAFEPNIRQSNSWPRLPLPRTSRVRSSRCTRSSLPFPFPLDPCHAG